jgi:hypothetical protein
MDSLIIVGILLAYTVLVKLLGRVQDRYSLHRLFQAGLLYLLYLAAFSRSFVATMLVLTTIPLLLFATATNYAFDRSTSLIDYFVTAGGSVGLFFAANSLLSARSQSIYY